jgi:hypothetical protein
MDLLNVSLNQTSIRSTGLHDQLAVISSKGRVAEETALSKVTCKS